LEDIIEEETMMAAVLASTTRLGVQPNLQSLINSSFARFSKQKYTNFIRISWK